MKRRQRPTPKSAPSRAPATSPLGWSSEALALALVLVAALAIHGAALTKPFFADDYLFLDQVRHRSLPQALVARDPIGNFFRPVGRQAYFWVVSRVGRESPLVSHAANLALFGLAVTLLYLLARRLAGPRAGLVAAAFLALHYAGDVPVHWASGSQDLLAVCGGTAAVLLHVSGRRLWATLPFLAGLLSKETVFFTPVIAALADWHPGETWRAPLRRAWPLFAVWPVWGAAWLATRSQHAVAAGAVETDPLGLLAALGHLPQAALGLELRTDRPFALVGRPLDLLAVALASAAVAWMFSRRGSASRGREGKPPGYRTAVGAGLVWAGLASLPIAAAASLWSSYYYLFALCGGGLALGAALARARPAWAAAAVLALGVLSTNARGLDEFATARGPWTTQSHVNRFYLDRAMNIVGRHLVELKRLRPGLPPRSTLFFSRFAPFIAWQAGDGPLVRWAYGDSSLRSYYFSAFTAEKAKRGPMYFFSIVDDTLRDVTDRPNVIPSLGWTMVLEGKKLAGEEVIRYALENGKADPSFTYLVAWLELDRGDTAAAYRLLRFTGAQPRAGPAPERALADRALAAGDSARALQLLSSAVPKYVLDPVLHARLSELLDRLYPGAETAVIEAYVATVLDPENPASWKRWAVAQISRNLFVEAKRSMDRFYALGGDAARADREAIQISALLQRLLPGGELIQRSLRQ